MERKENKIFPKILAQWPTLNNVKIIRIYRSHDSTVEYIIKFKLNNQEYCFRKEEEPNIICSNYISGNVPNFNHKSFLLNNPYLSSRDTPPWDIQIINFEKVKQHIIDANNEDDLRSVLALLLILVIHTTFLNDFIDIKIKAGV